MTYKTWITLLCQSSNGFLPFKAFAARCFLLYFDVLMVNVSMETIAKDDSASRPLWNAYTTLVYLLDFKPQLIYFFPSFSVVYNWGLLTVKVGLHCSFYILSKRYAYAQLFLGYDLSTKLSFHIHFSITCALHHRRDFDEQKAVVVKHHYQSCQKRKTC